MLPIPTRHLGGKEGRLMCCGPSPDSRSDGGGNEGDSSARTTIEHKRTLVVGGVDGRERRNLLQVVLP